MKYLYLAIITTLLLSCNIQSEYIFTISWDNELCSLYINDTEVSGGFFTDIYSTDSEIKIETVVSNTAQNSFNLYEFPGYKGSTRVFENPYTFSISSSYTDCLVILTNN